jgi:hypothetical protein
MYDIESHPLLGAGEVSGNFRELVTTINGAIGGL